MHRIMCAEIWGGIRDEDRDACSAGLTASLYSGACDGGKGGDIYYISVCGQDKLTRVAIADVVGHGSAVSDVSQWLYESLQARMNDPESRGVLADLNAVACGRGLSAMTTAAVVGFYLDDSNVSFSYAGHHPMLIRRRGEEDWREAPVGAAGEGLVNLPLGVAAESAFAQDRMPLSSGDRLLLYTDGVIEAPDPAGRLFGLPRLRAVLARVAAGPLADVKTAVLDAVRAHTGGSLAHDDVTLLAVEIS